MNPEARPTAAVIGGGIAGLVAARDLARAGLRVTLVEREATLGGRVQAGSIAGTPFDLGAEAFATRGDAVETLLEELGLSSEIVRPNPARSWIVSADRACPMPSTGAAGMPVSPLSRAGVRARGLPGALRAACEPLLPRRIGRADGMLADLVTARFGRTVTERLVGPIARGVYSTGADRLRVDEVPGLSRLIDEHRSLTSAAKRGRDAARAAGSAVASLRGGMHRLVSALVAELGELGVELVLDTEVLHLDSDSAGAHLRLRGRGAAGEPGGETTLDADLVVQTVALPRLDPVRRAEHTPTEAATRIEVIALLIDDARLDAAPRGTGALVAPGESGITAKALTHVTAKWAWQDEAMGPGRHLLRLSYGEVGRDASTLGLSDDAARRCAVSDASRIVGVPLDPRMIIGMARAPWALPPRRGAHGAVTAPPCTAVAGEWVSGTGLAAVIPGARRAARDLITTSRTIKTKEQTR